MHGALRVAFIFLFQYPVSTIIRSRTVFLLSSIYLFTCPKRHNHLVETYIVGINVFQHNTILHFLCRGFISSIYVLLQDAQVGMALPFSKHLGQCSYRNHGSNL